MEWFNSTYSKGIPISGPMLQENAHKFASNFGVEKFNASKIWLDKFCIWYKIVFKQCVCVGESADVNQDVIDDC